MKSQNNKKDKINIKRLNDYEATKQQQKETQNNYIATKKQQQKEEKWLQRDSNDCRATTQQ